VKLTAFPSSSTNHVGTAASAVQRSAATLARNGHARPSLLMLILIFDLEFDREGHGFSRAERIANEINPGSWPGSSHQAGAPSKLRLGGAFDSRRSGKIGKGTSSIRAA
jgi:hypothetical protein